MLYLSHRERETQVLGPGLRYALWTQGCKKRCPGCVFPQGRSLDFGGEYVSATKIFNEIAENPNLTGVTISGGEPFLQPTPLAKLIKMLREKTSLDVMIYTGYLIEELKEKQNPHIDFLLKNIDILIDGEYVEAQNTNSLWRGSDNQRIHFLTDKYLPFKEKILTAKNRSVEFVARTNEELFMIGLPPKNFEEELFKKLRKY